MSYRNRNKWSGDSLGSYWCEGDAFESELKRIRHGSNPAAHDSMKDYIRGAEEHNYQRLVRETAGILFSWTDGTDEPSFAWIVLLKDGKYACVSGGHDYTGWDCQSSFGVDAVDVSEWAVARFLVDDPRRAWEETRGEGSD